MKKVLAIVLALTMVLVFAAPVLAVDITKELIADGPDSDYTLGVGQVDVTNDASNIYVTFTIDEGDWELVEAHADVQASLALIPQTGNGNPKVGKFAQSDSWDPTEGDQLTVTFAFPYDNSGDVFVIAAQAVVCDYTQVDPDTLVAPRVESAWASGTQFNTGRNWAMYFAYDSDIIL